ncbi:MAG: helix-turn-helix domain-containing protein [Cyanobacteria bacterium P01_A01_bin.17]
MRQSDQPHQDSRTSGNALNVVQKVQTIFDRMGPEWQLQPAALKVLIALIQRQNPKSGRCDPSAMTLMRDTGLKERTVRGATTELAQKGLIIISRKGSWGRNRYKIVPASPEDIARKLSVERDHDMQTFAEEDAEICMSAMQDLAPKKRKEKIKKKKATQYPTVGPERFEANIVKAFMKAGLTYEDLINLPTGLFVRTYENYASGAYSFTCAVKKLVEALPR